MSKLTVSEHFECSPEQAFTAVTDFPNAPNYISGITKTEMLTDGPVGLNSRVRETRTMFGREATEEMEITLWQPPRKVVIEAHSHGAHYISTYSIEPDGSGCNVSMDFEAIPQTIMAKIMSVVMSGMIKSMEKMMLKDMQEAKIHAEKAAG